MKRKYLAFDIETAKILPDDFGDLLSHRPLGITCTATLAGDESEPRVFYSSDDDGGPSPRMTRADLSDFVDFLLRNAESGYTIVTLNGLGFDFDVLAEESGRLEDCKRLALGHVDMMFHVFCERGFCVGLSAASQALGMDKPEDVGGALAPRLWRDGEHQRVLDYVAHDCRLTMAVALRSEAERQLLWKTKRGTIAKHELPAGWLTVEQALALPLPDTSWMDAPWPRTKFTAWLDRR